MFTEIDILRVWVLVTGLAGFSTAIGCYTKPLSAHKTLYGRSPHTAHPEFSRMFGTWLLTSTCVRVAFFLDRVALLGYFLHLRDRLSTLWDGGICVQNCAAVPRRHCPMHCW
jgi:hypothetical protein